MISIRAQLVVRLVGGILLLSTGAGFGLYEYMEDVLEHSLDAALSAQAEAIAGDVVLDGNRPRLELPVNAIATSPADHGEYFFQIWRADGSTLARVAPPFIGQAPLPHITRPKKHFANARFNGHEAYRIFQLNFFPQPDEDSAAKPSTQPAEPLVLVVAHDRRSIDNPLAILLTGLIAAAAVICGGILLIVTLTVRRGLQPLAEVSALADKIGPETLEVRFPTGNELPPELVPIASKLNELLDRLSSAFARERRFSAAVAHELRTPLAELWSACDVALRWPDDVPGLSTALSEARGVAMQMSAMVQSLLSLARQQSGLESNTTVVEIPLSKTINTILQELAATLNDRRITVENRVDELLSILADPGLLTAVLRNLLENAADYTPTGGMIFIRTEVDSDQRMSLHIVNTCTDLTPADMPRLFEPFWRKDPSRTASHHSGLGLSLVQAYCQAMSISIAAVLISEKQVEVRMQFSTAKI